MQSTFLFIQKELFIRFQPKKIPPLHIKLRPKTDPELLKKFHHHVSPQCLHKNLPLEYGPSQVAATILIAHFVSKLQQIVYLQAVVFLFRKYDKLTLNGFSKLESRNVMLSYLLFEKQHSSSSRHKHRRYLEDTNYQIVWTTLKIHKFLFRLSI